MLSNTILQGDCLEVLQGMPDESVHCIVLDPFIGSGTVAAVAKQHRRNYIGIELNPEYIELANKRINNTSTRMF